MLKSSADFWQKILHSSKYAYEKTGLLGTTSNQVSPYGFFRYIVTFIKNECTSSCGINASRDVRAINHSFVDLIGCACVVPLSNKEKKNE